MARKALTYSIHCIGPAAMYLQQNWNFTVDKNCLKLPIHRGRRGQTPMRQSPLFGNDEDPAGTENCHRYLEMMKTQERKILHRLVCPPGRWTIES